MTKESNQNELSYQDAIDKLKETYPQLKEVNFTITDGLLSYVCGRWSLIDQIDMGKLQKFVNIFLGQKVYRIEYVGFADVYARSEEEAMLFSDDIRPIVTSRIKITETTLDKTNFY